MKIPPEQRRRLEERCDGMCECGCGMSLPRKDDGGYWYHPHHMPPLGFGKHKVLYPDEQIIILLSSQHREEHDKGCPHTEEWIQRLKDAGAG